MSKVILILSDGMRPDSLEACGNPYAMEFIKNSVHSLKTRTVMPSVTLPCHMSLMHSVPPERHGTMTNVYNPQVRPVSGLFEQANGSGKKTAIFYDWGELRDISLPYSPAHSLMISGHTHGFRDSGYKLADEAIKYVNEEMPDFMFLYFGDVDETGHMYGWMSKEYLEAVSVSWDHIKKVCSSIPEEYTVIVTADHGGHGRSHGTDMEEDMLIPLLIKSNEIEACEFNQECSILDIAPTIAKLIGAPISNDWEGKALI